MKKHTGFAFVLSAAVALFATATPAFAIPISQTIDLGTVFTGTTPNGSPPWLVATFAQTGSNTGTLTLTSQLTNGNFLQGLNSKKATIGWAFFLDQSLSGLSCHSGTCADNGDLFGGSYNAGPVKGGFNLAFGWSSKNRFDGSESAVYDLTFASALTGNPFGPNGNGWLSVAHVQGINVNGCGGSGWIVDDNGTGTGAGKDVCGGGGNHNVPEPGSLGMLGLGTLLIGLFFGMRRRYS